MSTPTTLKPSMFASAAPANALVRILPARQNLPDDSTRTGNLFTDRYDPSLTWYLPGFGLADDPDAAFAFAAAQSGIDSSGNPFDRATLTVGLVKTVPDDVATFRTQNPSATLREIPLNGLSVTLSTTANDPASGATTSNSYPGTVAAATDSSLTVTFAGLLGTGVLVAYQNLRTTGASLALSASYDVWHKAVWRNVFPVVLPLEHATLYAPQFAEPAQMRSTVPIRRVDPGTPVLPIYRGGVHPVFPVGSFSYTQGTGTFSLPVPVGGKYAASEYATRYTITGSQGTRVIATIDDLKAFDVNQSEFSEFTALGDISQKYQSFSRLYIGALSRTIVAVPATYGIVRSSSGTAAICRAVLDSSATGTGACRFEFSFTIAPVVSPIELAQLENDVAANAASSDCTVVLPERLDMKNTSTLATAFETTVAYAAGNQPQTFSVTLSVADANAPGSAVASANLLIAQLTTQAEPYLQGSLFIALDDYYPNPVATAVTLNFTATSGSNDLGMTFDTTAQAMDLVNTSPLDLQVSRYAVVTGGALAPQPFAATIPANTDAALPGSGLTAKSLLLVDRTLSLESPITKSDIQRYLTFDIHDVQDVEYQLGLLASGVNFVGRGIAQLKVAVVLDDLPSIAVPSFTVTAQDQSGEVVVTLPLQYAISVLTATVSITVVFSDPTLAPVPFTSSNDFVGNPVLVLTDQDIPTQPAPATASGND
jgi:hypothetical protein